MLRLTRNHYETTLDITAADTTTDFTIATGVDDVSNRSTHIPDGAVLKYIRVIIRYPSLTAGTYRAAMWRRPGAETAPTDFIASWLDTTDPITANAIRARRFKMRGPKQTVQVAGAANPITTTLNWKGAMKIRDGDDIILSLRAPAANIDPNVYVSLGYINV